MIGKQKITRALIIGPVAAAMLGAGILMGCAGDNGIMDGRETGAGTTQEISRGENPGEHGAASESSGESSGSGSEEASGATLAPGDTFDAIRVGARLILNYDADEQLIQRHGGEHHRQHPGPGQDRSAPVQRYGTGADQPRWIWPPER